MSNYTKATNFATKDTLPTGDANKIVKGTEIDNEFNSISGAISSKADIASPTFTGAPAAPTATAGSNTTQLANTAFVKAEITALSLANMSTQAKSAVDITGGTIVGITDLAVADGGTGASTLTGVVIGNGTSAMTAVAPSTSGNVLTSNGTTWASTAPAVVSGLGLNGEVWNNVTGSRVKGTTYTNSRSYPIQVIVAGGQGGNSGGEFYINGNMVANSYVSSANHQWTVTAIIPPSSTYKCDGTYATINTWYELY